MEINLFLVFLAGLGSFLSPCVLPLVPSYLAFLGGNLKGNLKGTQGERKPSLVPTLAFIAGFSAVFILLGLTMAGLGGLFSRTPGIYALVSLAAGMFLIMFGLHLSFGLFPILYREVRYHPQVSRGLGVLRSFGIGASFGAGWTPCIGPILAGVLTLAASTGSPALGFFYLGAYSLGLGVPLLLAAIFFDRFQALRTRLSSKLGTIQRWSGYILLGLGILVATGRFQTFTGFIVSLGLSLEQWSMANPLGAQVAFTVFYGILAVGGWFWSKKLTLIFGILEVLEALGILGSAGLMALWLQFEGF
ncbi:MAG: cytochrome c biogenesis protein CcdA [Spirochaetales bacterium]|nr:cytochrome c biogenesis protein CcdA [Spirochaetales bacterium]